MLMTAWGIKSLHEEIKVGWFELLCLEALELDYPFGTSAYRWPKYRDY